jgi:hypothetical protein
MSSAQLLRFHNVLRPHDYAQIIEWQAAAIGDETGSIALARWVIDIVVEDLRGMFAQASDQTWRYQFPAIDVTQVESSAAEHDVQLAEDRWGEPLASESPNQPIDPASVRQQLSKVDVFYSISQATQRVCAVEACSMHIAKVENFQRIHAVSAA